MLVAFSVGTSYGWSSPALPKLLAVDSPIHISEDEGTWIVSLINLAAVFSPILSGYMVDKCGRKITLLVSAVPLIVGWILILVANSVAILYASRVMSGVGLGMVYSTAPIYLADIATDKLRGSIGVLFGVMSKLGMLVSYSTVTYVSIKTYAAIALVFPVVFIATFIWFPESPYYLMSRNRPDDAIKSLQQLRGQDDVKEELGMVEKFVQKNLENRGSFKSLLQSPGNRKGMMIIFVLTTSSHICGIQAIITYANTIFNNVNGSLDPTESSIILAAVQVVAAAASSFMVDTLGRRPLLLISGCGTAITTAAVGTYFFLKDYLGSDVSNIEWIPLTALVIFFICYTLGFATVIYIMLGEIFPANFKALANSADSMYSNVLGFGVIRLYIFIVGNWGSYVAFWTFSGCMILGSIFIYFLVPETKGKSFLQIQAEMNGQKYDEERRSRPIRNTIFTLNHSPYFRIFCLCVVQVLWYIHRAIAMLLNFSG